MLASSSSIGKALVAGLLMVGCLACVFIVTSSEDTVLIDAEAKATAALYEEKLGLIQKADPALRKKILEAIVDLRAYSEVAYDAVEEYKNQNANNDMGLLELVLEFAKVYEEKVADEAGDKADRDRARRKAEAKAKKKAILAQDRDVDRALIEGRDPLPERAGHDIDGCVVDTQVWCESLNKCLSKEGAVCPPDAPPYNVVVDYATAIGKVRVDSHRGLGHYLAQHLDQAIMGGKSPIAKFTRAGKPVAGFDYKVLGLEEMPKYFYMISVPYSKFEIHHHRVTEDSSSADVAAAAMWLSKGASDQYKTFMQRQQDIKNEKINEYHNAMIEKSKDAIHEQFEKQAGDKDLYLRLRGLAAKGFNAADTVDPPELRTQAQVAADAKKAAAEWLKENTDDAPEEEAKEVKEEEEAKEEEKQK